MVKIRNFFLKKIKLWLYGWGACLKNFSRFKQGPSRASQLLRPVHWPACRGSSAGATPPPPPSVLFSGQTPPPLLFPFLSSPPLSDLPNSSRMAAPSSHEESSHLSPNRPCSTPPLLRRWSESQAATEMAGKSGGGRRRRGLTFTCRNRCGLTLGWPGLIGRSVPGCLLGQGCGKTPSFVRCLLVFYVQSTAQTLCNCVEICELYVHLSID